MNRPINAYDKALVNIKEKLLAMGATAEITLTDAVMALIQGNSELARCVLSGDAEIDRTDDLLEQDALNLISLAQPTEADLRFLTAVIRISHELERICDNACNIAEIAVELSPKSSWTEIMADLVQMTRQVGEMLQKCLRIFRDRDLNSARCIEDDDRIIDRRYSSLVEKLKDCMKKDPGFVDDGSGLLLSIRFLERIGDHSVNIAEMVVFAETGERRR